LVAAALRIANAQIAGSLVTTVRRRAGIQLTATAKEGFTYPVVHGRRLRGIPGNGAATRDKQD